MFQIIAERYRGAGENMELTKKAFKYDVRGVVPMRRSMRRWKTIG